MVMIRLLTSSVALRLDENAEFAEKYFRQGLKVVVTGRIQTGSYTNKDGQKVYTTDVVVEEQEFAESKATSDANGEVFPCRVVSSRHRLRRRQLTQVTAS